MPWLFSPVGYVVVLLVIGLLSMRRIIKQIWQLPRVALKQFASDILRLAFLLNRPRRLAQKGFVLPTTVLLTIMVALTVTALTYRTFVRSEQAIGQREQRVIVNAATPAIDRAKAKIEFLFQSENIPYLPSSDELYDRMSTRLSAGRKTRGYGGNVDLLNGGFDTDKVDPYTLADETRVDINGDGVLDNAWAFKSEGKSLVYSILVDNKIVASDGNSTNVKLGRPYVAPAITEAGKAGPLLSPGVIDIKDRLSQGKANALVTRTGPLATTEVAAQCQQQSSSGEVAGDWQVVNQDGSSTLQKNFQINAFVTDIDKDIDKTFETLEFQQSRKAARANKWGAWFRYDLEIPLGSQPFNWNGAMHTDSNLIINNRGTGALNLYMVSSPASCVYSKDSSEITLGRSSNFEGQVVKGSMRDDDYGLADPTIHIFNGDGVRPRTGDQLTNGNHSVEGGRPSDISVNAIKLFTEDTLEHMRAAGAGIWNRRPAWDTADNIFGAKSPNGGRLINNEVDRPIIDDFYRADDRWGPKPRYENSQDTANPVEIPTGTTIGQDIVGNQYDRLTDESDGLDGFWERQAIKKGLRLIVGQRLELGNTNGWNYDPRANSNPANSDPLYPANDRKSTLAATNTAIGGDHEYLQRKALRDNLAAVQGMVVYHYEKNNGEFPAACVALTAHPGTRQSIVNSRTFPPRLDSPTLPKTNFLRGKGTNGWEFQFPYTSATGFANAVGSGQPLRTALTNLAYFAGDPDGGAPSFKPEQGKADVVHPFPYLSMWGDFSVLRRILDSGKSYANLSPADQATLHSAACTLGLLAYNLESLGSTPDSINVSTTEIGSIPKGTLPGGWQDIARELLTIRGVLPAGNLINSITSDTWINTWSLPTNGFNSEDPNDLLTLRKMEAISDFFHVLRDRQHGFLSGAIDTGPGVVPPTFGTFDPATGFTPTTGTPEYPATAAPYSVACNPNWLAANTGVTTLNDALTLALALCPKRDASNGAVKYPSLYYLFPLASHGQIPASLTTPLTPASEEYLYRTAANAAPTGGDWGRLLVPNNPNTYNSVSLADIKAIPRSIPTGAPSWTIPASAASTTTPLRVDVTATPGNDDNTDDLTHAFVVNVGSTPRPIQVPFLDKGIYDGREQINTRVLDIDLYALTTQTVGTDYWLSSDLDRDAEGIVYAFREDAVREDEIVRPKNSSATIAGCSATTGTNPVRFTIETDANCRMRVQPGTAVQDPPLTAKGISLKPVDFIGDPERRPYGFRLRTSRLTATREPEAVDFSGNSLAREVGMTFVTDNSAYIMGDFNLHSTTGQRAGIVEEFEDTLLKDVPLATYLDAFYNRAALNTDTFANLEQDHWRPVEILADANSILSGGFLDGAVEDGFLRARPAAQGGNDTTTSYMNQNRPVIIGADLPPNQVIREQASNTSSPVWVDRNGTYYVDPRVPRTGTLFYPFYDVTNGYSLDPDDAGNQGGCNNTTNLCWQSFARNNTARSDQNSYRRQNVQTASDTFVNAVFVSGIVPKRPRQGYGGLHNYPRLLEYWSGQNLYIAGAFFQLNFATAATGPYEQDAWEEGQNPTATEPIGYYEPPIRRWGYDVGLLYVPPAPAARRFVFFGNPRNEYYREVPADDPYTLNLRCARTASGDLPTDRNGKPLLTRELCPLPGRA